MFVLVVGGLRVSLGVSDCLCNTVAIYLFSCVVFDLQGSRGIPSQIHRPRSPAIDHRSVIDPQISSDPSIYVSPVIHRPLQIRYLDNGGSGGPLFSTAAVVVCLLGDVCRVLLHSSRICCVSADLVAIGPLPREGYLRRRLGSELSLNVTFHRY